MKRLILTGILAILAASLTVQAAEDVELVKGEDRIDVPAISDGLCVCNVFQSNMVIQRDKPITVWGWAAPGEEVTVKFAGEKASVKAGDDRSWKVSLPAKEANSEPQAMTVTGKDESIELKNILVGDVWLCSGQSNMEFDLAKIVGGRLEIASAHFPKIRLLTVPHLPGPDARQSFPRMYQWSGWSRRHFRQGDWDVCSPDTVPQFSGIGYIFARRLHMATQVPIGMIDVSVGGTCVETWVPLDVLKGIDTPEVKAKLQEWDEKIAEFDPQADLEARIKSYNDRTERIKKSGGDVSDRKPPTEVRPNPSVENNNRPGNLYAGMIAPLSGLAVKGAIWHQGFNNAFQANGHVMYYQVFPKMIESWRKTFNDPEMAFGIISLCTAGDPQDLNDYCERMPDEGIYIRAVQYQTFVDLKNAGDKNIGFASSYDQRRSWYHPQIKIPVGERIARWALATQYGVSGISWEPPTYKEMAVEDGKILLKGCDSMSAYYDGPMLGFAIAGEDGKFQPAEAEHMQTGEKDRRGRVQRDRKVIVLSSPLVPNPVHFRYAWGRNPLANVKAGNNDDIPFATQRSDKWNIPDMYEQYTGKKTEEPGVLSRGERGELNKALRAADLERRLKEAEALIEKQKKEGVE